MGKLTVKELESLAALDEGHTLFDGEGLYGKVRQQKSGMVVCFEYRYRAKGKVRTASCGKWPVDSLKEIRRLRDQKSQLVASGADPVDLNKAEKLRQKVVTAQTIERHQSELNRIAVDTAARRSFGDAIGQWAGVELARRKDGGQEALRALQKDVLPMLGSVALVDVKRSMLMDALDSVVQRGSRVMANHLFADLRQFYNYAVVREWVDTHPLAGMSKEKIGGRQKERDRYLKEQEITELQQCLEVANLLHSTELAIWIMLSTCCRVGELSQARWNDVNLENGEWLIPASNSKNAKPHTVFLSAFAKEQFHKLQSINGDSGWCLPSRDGSTHICLKSISKQIKDRTRDTALSNRTLATGSLLLSGGAWTPHDLRRTGATLMGELGVMGEVIEKCLNHVEQNKLKRIYQRHELKAEQREAWRLLGDRIALLLAAKKAGNLVVGHFAKKG